MTTAAQGARTRQPHVPIEDHGIIGDLHTAALVSTDGDIDWLCLPRFDSPSVFASFLDDERGGRFTVRCTGATRVKQMYLPDSNILLTRFLASSPSARSSTSWSRTSRAATDTARSQLVRLVRAVRGRVEVEVRCAPAFDYARARTEVDIVEGSGAFFSSPLAQLVLRSTVPLTADGHAASADPVLEEGESLALALSRWGSPHPLDGGGPACWPRSSTGSGGSAGPATGPVPGDGGAVGADAEAARLPAHRGAGGRTDDLAAGGDRGHAQLGLPLHVGP